MGDLRMAAASIDMHQGPGRMSARGGCGGRTAAPPGIHRMCASVHEPAAAEGAEDLERAIAHVHAGQGPVTGRAVC